MATTIKELMDDYTGKSIYNLHKEDKKEINKRYKKNELLDIALELKVENFSSMNKEQLIESIQQKAYVIEYENKMHIPDDEPEVEITDDHMEEVEEGNKEDFLHLGLIKLLTQPNTADYFNGKEVVTTVLPITSDELFITCEYTFQKVFADYSDFREYIMSSDNNELKLAFRLWESKWKKLSVTPNRWENNAGKLNNDILPMYQLTKEDGKRIADKYIKIVEGFIDDEK